MYRILIVEDDAVIANAVQKHLVSWGYEARIAEDFENVLPAFAQYAPQLVLMDISLPFFNGYHWCSEIRKISKVPVIFITSMLKIDHLTKTYGDKKAVDDLSLHIAPGEIYGFIGHNGAGKTTTIKACCGILPFDGGEITVDGKSVKTDPIGCKAVTAYIPDNPDLYDFMSGIKYLTFIADVFGVSKSDREERVLRYADTFGLTSDLAQPISAYSHGMRSYFTPAEVTICSWIRSSAIVSACLSVPDWDYFISSLFFFTSSMVPHSRKACSGILSHSPPRIASMEMKVSHRMACSFFISSSLSGSELDIEMFSFFSSFIFKISLGIAATNSLICRMYASVRACREDAKGGCFSTSPVRAAAVLTALAEIWAAISSRICASLSAMPPVISPASCRPR